MAAQRLFILASRVVAVSYISEALCDTGIPFAKTFLSDLKGLGVEFQSLFILALRGIADSNVIEVPCDIRMQLA